MYAFVSTNALGDYTSLEAAVSANSSAKVVTLGGKYIALANQLSRAGKPADAQNGVPRLTSDGASHRVSEDCLDLVTAKTAAATRAAGTKVANAITAYSALVTPIRERVEFLQKKYG